MGIDRMTMLLTDTANIKEVRVHVHGDFLLLFSVLMNFCSQVLLFPAMKPIADAAHE